MANLSNDSASLLNELAEMQVSESFYNKVKAALLERDEYALKLFEPIGASHHNANKCQYCIENREQL